MTMAEGGEVSSSSDNLDIADLCSDASYSLLTLETSSSNIADQVNKLRRTLKEIKTYVLDTHNARDESARDDILADILLLEELHPLVDQLTDICDKTVKKLGQR